MKTYHAVYERDESGAWLVHVDEHEGCHSFGRTLAQAREHIVEALAAWLDEEPAAFEVVDVHRLPEDLRAAVDASNDAQNRARIVMDEAESLRMDAIGRLLRAGLSMRDVAAIVNLSHQRVAQVAQYIERWQLIVGNEGAAEKNARRGARDRRSKSAAIKKNPVVVKHSGSDWVVSRGDHKRALGHFSTKKEAEQAARRIAAQQKADLVVHPKRPR